MFKIRNTLLLMLLCFFTLHGCNKEQPSKMTMLTDIKLLSRFINLPVDPKKVKFEVINISSNDTQIFVVLEFNEGNFKRVLKIFDEPIEPSSNQSLFLSLPDWFNPDLLPEKKKLEEEYIIEAEHLKPADKFYSSPYLSGSSILIKQENTLLVVLYTR